MVDRSGQSPVTSIMLRIRPIASRLTIPLRAILTCLCSLSIFTTGCDDAPIPVPPAADVRPVRVLLFDTNEGLRLRIDGPARVRSGDGEVVEIEQLDWESIVTPEATVSIDGQSLNPPMTIEPQNDGTLMVSRLADGEYSPARQYSGSLRIERHDDGELRVINDVDVEAYVASVVPHEVISYFRQQTLRAQAITARGYVLYAMARSTAREYDVRASEGDQVYGGIAHGDIGNRSRKAVNATRGLVLAEQGSGGPRIFSPFYSSACGGSSQPVDAVMPGRVPAPLRGGVVCDFCKIAPQGAYRWGPASITRGDLLARMKQRYRKTAAWKSIKSIEITGRGDRNRITEVVITGDTDEPLTLGGEQFRLAAGGRTMRSTDCEIDVGEKEITFHDGKGFGHGVGMCQWGAEGQARQGKKAGEILSHYFPDSQLVRAY